MNEPLDFIEFICGC